MAPDTGAPMEEAAQTKVTMANEHVERAVPTKQITVGFKIHAGHVSIVRKPVNWRGASSVI
jgi:hypothetical protein